MGAVSDPPAPLFTFVETVLFVLLQHFKFEPTGKSIEWNFAGVQYPSVGMGGPEMPLKVSFLRP